MDSLISAGSSGGLRCASIWSGRCGRYGEGQDWGSPLDFGWLPDGPGWNLRTNGGMLSTAADLYRWHLALESGALLSEGSRRKLQAQHVPAVGTAPRGSSSGYGVYVKETEWGTLASRGGTSAFGNSHYFHFAGAEFVLVLTTNSEHIPVWEVSNRLAGTVLAPGEPFTFIP